jgi:hypothetical protein
MMKNLLRRILTFRFRPATVPLFLLFLCLAAYSPLVTRLGFYWDDFPMNWIASTMGREGLARYFSTNRPVWGLIYQATTTLLGSRPLTWQITAILLRWADALLLWALLRQLWPAGGERAAGSTGTSAAALENPAREQFALWAAALFAIYPGFSQQFISFLYSHFYIVLAAFLLSLILMTLSVRQGAGPPRWRYGLLTGAALLLSLLNMLSMEYFFLLDLLRPLFIWVTLSPLFPQRRLRLRRTLLHWLPYLAFFAAAMFWRSVLFGFHTYQPALMSRLKAQPVDALLQFIPLVFQDVWKTGALAWAKAFAIPTLLEAGARNLQRYWLVVAAGALACAVYLLLFRARPAVEQPGQRAPGDPRDRRARFQSWAGSHLWAWQPVAIGVLALFIAGGPFWLTDLEIGLVFPNDRFTLPFILGASLALAGLATLLPLPRWFKAALLSVTFGFAIGLQYQHAITYSRDWSVQRTMFWQMAWRMPDLQPGTALLSNELPVIHYTDNSLTAPLNWTYDPENNPPVMQYALLYPTLRKEAMLSNFKANQLIKLDYLAAAFQGNTSQMVAFYYNPPGCLRVLDPEVDVYNWMVPVYLRESLRLTTTDPILPESQPGKSPPRPPAHIFGEEIAHGWCYYFEKADLARQLGDWQRVADLGNEAFAGSDYPNDPLERFTFIEGYAHTGDWDRAHNLTQDTYSFSPQVMQPMLCKLWERIERETSPSVEKQKTTQSIQAELNCSQALK